MLAHYVQGLPPDGSGGSEYCNMAFPFHSETDISGRINGCSLVPELETEMCSFAGVVIPVHADRSTCRDLVSFGFEELVHMPVDGQEVTLVLDSHSVEIGSAPSCEDYGSAKNCFHYASFRGVYVHRRMLHSFELLEHHSLDRGEKVQTLDGKIAEDFTDLELLGFPDPVPKYTVPFPDAASCREKTLGNKVQRFFQVGKDDLRSSVCGIFRVGVFRSGIPKGRGQGGDLGQPSFP